jgi:hypothetical protein
MALFYLHSYTYTNIFLIKYEIISLYCLCNQINVILLQCTITQSKFIIMKKFIVTCGIFEGTSFYGDIVNKRVVNNETIGQSYPVENCDLIYVSYGTYINDLLIINVIELEDKSFLYGLARTNKKGNAIKGGKGAGGTHTIKELLNLLIKSNN